MDTQVGDPLLGSLVDGRYHVRERTARDGMASTYLAVDERLRRTVVLKVLQPEHPGQPFHLNRFADEVTNLARLTHPNAVVWLGQGMHAGLPYLVLEHVRGQTLRQVLAERGRLAPLEALAIAEQLLSALAAGHRAGLVHRDVRPENIQVAESPGGGHSLVDAVVKVADLGLVSAIEAGGGQPTVTAAYVCPEQVADGRSDQRGDVYSTGIVLFEMLTGRVPYEGPRPAEVAWQHVQQDVPAPSRLVPGLPPVLDDLVASATRRNPAARFMDAGALLQAVQAAREALTVSAATQVMRPPAHTRPYHPPTQPLAEETMIVGQVSPAQRPSWARLPGSEGQPEPRRQAAAGGGATALLDQAREHFERLKADPRGRMGLIAGAVVLALLVLTGGWWLFSGRYDAMPQVMNLPKDQAVAALEELGLEVAFAAPQYRENTPKDVVLFQDPAPGDNVSSGETVTLTLSAGPESRQVPDVAGKTWDAAIVDLQAEPLLLKPVKAGERFDDLVPKGTVIETDPKAGETVEPGSAVKVILSKGRAPITIPFVEGKALRDARSELENLGLKVSVEYVDSDKAYETVVKQEPATGTGAERGDTVKLQVSNNRNVLPGGEQQMPELRNWNCGDAENHLLGMGLRVELRGVRGGDDKNRYRVERQFPGAGSRIQPGQRVILRCEARR